MPHISFPILRQLCYIAFGVGACACTLQPSYFSSCTLLYIYIINYTCTQILVVCSHFKLLAVTIIMFMFRIQARMKTKQFCSCLSCLCILLLALVVLYYEAQRPKRTSLLKNKELVPNTVAVSSIDDAFFVSSQQRIGVVDVHIDHASNTITSNFKNSGNGTDRVLSRVRACLDTTHMVQGEEQRSLAMRNAQHLYQEYRKIIPTQFLSNYKSHCWEMHYDATSFYSLMYSGHLGATKIIGGLNKGPKSLRGPLQLLQSSFSGSFTTEQVCLPSIFLIGFPKCGSTYLWCFVRALVRITADVGMHSLIEITKEPHFWVKGAANSSRNISPPNAKDIGDYLLNFLYGLNSSNQYSNVPFIDGSPNIAFNWPRFDLSHPPDVNYCLVPSVLPVLLPKAKYVIVMRNPIKMLYSAFWSSCTLVSNELSWEVRKKAPLVFQDRASKKIHNFLNCMRDKQYTQRCSIEDDSSFSECIHQRLHLLDKCVVKITNNKFEDPMPECGKVRVETVLYYTHLRKWLSITPRTNMFVVTLEKLTTQPRAVASDILEFLGHSPSGDVLDQVSKVTSLCSTAENNQIVFNYKEDHRLKMTNKTLSMLQIFFTPFNHLLAELLNDKSFEW